MDRKDQIEAPGNIKMIVLIAGIGIGSIIAGVISWIVAISNERNNGLMRFAKTSLTILDNWNLCTMR